MTRITESQRVKIVRLFMGGTSMIQIHQAWDVDLSKIEDIIREAIKEAGAQP